MNESVYPDCTTLRFGKFWILCLELLGPTNLNSETVLNFSVSQHCVLLLSKEVFVSETTTLWMITSV